MRLSTSQLNDVMLTSMQTSTTGVNKAFIQLNSGEKMLKPSDDPLGSVQLMMLDREQATIDQFQKNIANLKGDLAQTESNIDASNNALLRVEELTNSILNASNSTMEGREAIATELEGLLDQLTDIANSKSPNGDYMFSGTKTDTQPIAKDPATGKYVYNGNSDQREVRIDESMTVPANQTADSMFFNGGDDIFNTLDQLVTDLRDPAVAGDSLTSAVTSAQGSIESTQNSVNKVMTAVGGHMNSLERVDGAHEDNKLLNKNMISEVKDLDYSEAILDLNTQMAALQATQMTYSKIQNLSLFKLM
ncbi:flagellar hook protein FlgL [Photobacterium aquae]|uniref:Flagellar hook protein FlgL n=1 Tax=Photobacterium aquae TaxID=1195763 RepID=A0A0J1H4F7_9GAMM|nr:flagellar hook-associated protein FlgL [Photobacterium aquae]KLV06604.1 flagellar hook protein FlgL [Photobacterium aquae]